LSNEKRIGDLLVESGVITRDALEDVLQRKPQVGERRLLSELYALGLAPERALAEALARRVGAPVAVLTESVLDLDIVRLIPPDVMRQQVALPVAADERTVTVVTPDPDAPGITVPLGFLTGRRVVLLLGIHAVLESFIERAIAARETREKLLSGPRATVAAPHLEVARDAPPLSLEEANAIARSIVEALADPPAGPPEGQPEEPAPRAREIGALRLKQMLIERPPPGEEPTPVAVPASGPIIIDTPRAALAPEAAPRGALREAAPDALTSEEAGQPVAIVVDDDDDIRTMLAKALKHDGLLVLEAKTGAEAATLLRLARPDIVILDAMLPQVHGFELCAGLKRSRMKDVPIIMISAVYRGWVQARDIQEVHGADHFVEKPFELTFVRRLVADSLKRPYAAPAPLVDPERVAAVRRRYEENAAARQYHAAGRDVDEWLALDPFDGEGWLERGNLCGQFGDLVSAMTSYEAAVVYDPTLLLAHLGLAMVYEQLGFRRRARATWLRARELAPDEETRSRIDAHLE
jgi:CheY-like chemotaxis protein